MTQNEIVEAIKDEQPTANYLHTVRGSMLYETTLKKGYIVRFEIPVSECRNAIFRTKEDAQLLIKWIKPLTD